MAEAERAEETAQSLRALAEEDAQKETEESQDAPDESTEEAAEGADAAEVESQDDPLAITKYVDEAYGLKNAQKYRSDEEFLRHVAEMERMVGRRDEDALLGKQVREKIGDGDLASVLAAKAPQAPKSNGPPEFDESWVRADENGSVVAAPGAPKDAVDKYYAYSRWLQGRLKQLATEPEKVLGDVLAERFEKLEKQAQEVREEAARQQQMAAAQRLCEQNQKLLYVGGDYRKGMSPQGEQVQALLADPEWVDEIPDDVARLKHAIRAVLAEQPKAKATPKPPASAKRQAEVATQPAEMTEEEEMKALAKRGLAAVLRAKAGVK